MNSHPLVAAFREAFPTDQSWTPEGRRVARYRIQRATVTSGFRVVEIGDEKEEVCVTQITLVTDSDAKIVIRSHPFYKEHRFDDGEYGIGVWSRTEQNGSIGTDLDLWMSGEALDQVRRLIEADVRGELIVEASLRYITPREDESQIIQLFVTRHVIVKNG